MVGIFSILNEPIVLLTLLAGSVLLVLIDYFFPVDWPAYGGYGLFAIFIGATIPASPVLSLLAMLTILVGMLVLHETLFSRYLTNAPRYECGREPNDGGIESADSENGPSEGSA